MIGPGGNELAVALAWPPTNGVAEGEAVALAEGEGEGEAVALAGVVVLRHCTWHGVVQFAPCTSYVPCVCRAPV